MCSTGADAASGSLPIAQVVSCHGDLHIPILLWHTNMLVSLTILKMPSNSSIAKHALLPHTTSEVQ